MCYRVEIQLHGRVFLDNFPVFDADVAVVDQLLEAVNELRRDAVAVLVTEAPSCHDRGDGRVEIAVGELGGLLGDVEVVNKDFVECNFLIPIDF